jgi:hypothetical protein
LGVSMPDLAWVWQLEPFAERSDPTVSIQFGCHSSPMCTFGNGSRTQTATVRECLGRFAKHVRKARVNWYFNAFRDSPDESHSGAATHLEDSIRDARECHSLNEFCRSRHGVLET